MKYIVFLPGLHLNLKIRFAIRDKILVRVPNLGNQNLISENPIFYNFLTSSKVYISECTNYFYESQN